MSEVGRIKIQEEKFTQCRPYLEYKDGMLYEVLKVGDCGSTIARVIDNRVVEQIKADAINECIEIVKNNYRMDALEKLEQLKELNNEQRRNGT